MDQPKFKIESNVPIPSKSFARGSDIFPVDRLAVGESFFAPGQRANKEYSPLGETILARLVATRNAYHRKTGRGPHFIIRSVMENNVRGLRVWRDA